MWTRLGISPGVVLGSVVMIIRQASDRSVSPNLSPDSVSIRRSASREVAMGSFVKMMI